MDIKTVIHNAWLDVGFEPKQTDYFGWIDIKLLPDILEIGELEGKHIIKKFSKTRKTLVRPKSLQGLEENNGWIKIENNVAPLPRIDNWYFVISKGSPNHVDCEFLSESRKWTWLNFVTHYQPILKPKLPIH